MSGCTHLLGCLPCQREDEHEGGEKGRGCVHDAGSWVKDAHSESSGE